jgi:hypothetical protein
MPEDYHHVDGVFMHPRGAFEKQVVNAALAEVSCKSTPEMLLRLTSAFQTPFSMTVPILQRRRAPKTASEIDTCGLATSSWHP